MTFEQFTASLKESSPPNLPSPFLEALWYDAKGDWHRSHQIAQDIDDRNGAWIHAYLHRKEGDLSNARYWYHRAAQPEPRVSLEKEWEMLVRNFL